MAYPDIDTATEVPLYPAPPGATESTGGPPTPSLSPTRRAVRRFRANWAAAISLAVLIVASLAALFAPFLSDYSPLAMHLGWTTTDQPPSAQHWLGTDGLGRDYYTRLLYGMRGPIGVAFSGAILCSLIGAALGIAAGYLGGWVDEILSRITEIVFVIPGLLLIILAVSLFGRLLDGPFGTAGRYIMIMLFLATDSWPVIMRLARSETLSMKSAQFVESAVVSGTSSRRIMQRHLLPNMLGVILVQGALLMPGFLFATSALGLFGLGAQPPEPDIGQMIVDGAQIMALNAVEALAPMTVLTILILAATFLGDGLRDAFDTRSA